MKIYIESLDRPLQLLYKLFNLKEGIGEKNNLAAKQLALVERLDAKKQSRIATE